MITGAPSTYVINASGAPGVAGGGNLITITSGNQVAYNGVTATSTSAVTSIVYIDHTAFQGNSAGSYYGPIISATSVGSAALTSPLPQILLSNTSLAYPSFRESRVRARDEADADVAAKLYEQPKVTLIQPRKSL